MKTAFILKFRNSFLFKVLGIFLAINLLGSLLPFQQLYALTSGPAQPEASSFQQVNVSNLVDPFTGDFSYNIPLMEVGGYPINLSYAAGPTMDQEASPVGLGWNVNIGAITRNMRGLPDDFNGDEVIRDIHLKKDVTVGVNTGVDLELFGWEAKNNSVSLSLGLDLIYNNYKGFSIGSSISPGIALGKSNKNTFTAGLGLSASGGAIDIQPRVGLSQAVDNTDAENESNSLNFGLSINSRNGLQSMTLDARNSMSNGSGRNTHNLGSVGIGTNISFSQPSYTPQIQIPMENFGLTLKGKFGISGSGADVDILVGGFYSEQKVAKESIITPGFGYMHSENAYGKSNALHDFNREKDGGFTFNTPNLALTNYTYDVFNIQAQGIGGSFRPFRNNVGYVFDSKNVNSNVSIAGGVEFSGGYIVDFGANINVAVARSRNQAWTNGNMAEPFLTFNKPEVNSIQEPVYFKQLGESKVDSDPGFYNRIKGDKPLAFSLNPGAASVNNQFVDKNGQQYGFSSKIERNGRESRNTLVQHFTVKEVRDLFPHAAKYIPVWAPEHHIAMIVVTNTDGTRYVFGCPAYNKEQVEITFAVGKGLYNSGTAPTFDPGNPNLVIYAGNDATPGNKKGLDNRYDATTTPAFVYAWYLTEVLTPDYVDVTGDGPSDDDLGNFTFFKYGVPSGSSFVPNVENYRWRTPLDNSSLRAQYNEGLKSDPTDDMANITYGEKHIWYLASIESKTQIANFHYSDRRDGFGVTGLAGTIGGSAQRRLDIIRLYSKEDYVNNLSGAKAIKEVHFNFSYELCTGVPNNPSGDNSPGVDDGGKLTLKEVYFTYERSGRAKFSPYKFTYSGNLNPTYNSRAVDRWGFYLPEAGGGLPPNHEYPYSTQDQTDADSYAAAWCISDITLPSGGIISVEYEADDYGYVQDNQATRMFKVVGASDTLNSTLKPVLYEKTILSTFRNFEYLYFDLEDPISGSFTQTEANKYILENYFFNGQTDDANPVTNLYFRFFTNINAKSSLSPQSEYVSGYVDVSPSPTNQYECGATRSGGGSSGPYDRGWVKINLTTVNDNGGNQINPISRAAWQFSRIYTPAYASNQPTPQDDSFTTIVKTVLGGDVGLNLVKFFIGPNKIMANEGYGSDFDPDRSYIRLYDPNKKKLGGGHRVKSVTIDDNWMEMTGNSESISIYGQEYTYTTEDGNSSGVASWEPVVGADENVNRLPIYFPNKNQNKLIPDNRFYHETPVGECFYPAPVIGYSRVRINNLERIDPGDPDNSVTNNATGYVVHEFYTARDFPAKTDRTGIKFERVKFSGISSFLGIPAIDYVTASQGFVIELNDMHGKPKGEKVYEENVSEPISRKEYIYNLKAPDQLSSTVPAVNRDGEKYSGEMGVDYDMVADFREFSSESVSAGVQVNLATFTVGFFPALIPTLFPDINIELTRFRSATTTKVINRSGILMETIAYDLGSRVATKNVGFDERTGEVLVTQVNNEYDDDRFAVSIPAHWAYDRMGFASDNWGYEFEVTPDTYISNSDSWNRTTGAVLPPASDYLVPGDEVTMPETKDFKFSFLPAHPAYSGSMKRLWVSADSLGTLYYIDQNGIPFTSIDTVNTYVVKVIRSGRRNQPVASVSSLEMLENPFNVSNELDLVQSRKILNASSQEFRELWKTHSSRQREYTQDYLIETFTGGFDMTKAVESPILNGTNYTGNFFGNTYVYQCNQAGITPVTSSDTYTITTGTHSGLGFYSGLVGKARMDIKFKYNSGADSAELALVCLDPIGTFPTAAFANIAYLNPGMNIPYFSNPAYTFYTTNITGGSPDHMVSIVTDDGVEHYFVARVVSGTVHTLDNKHYTYTNEAACNFATGDTINPYLYGNLGNWRPLRSYTYLVDRNDDTTSANIDLRQDGYFDNFAGNFWQTPSSPGGFWEKISSTFINPQAWRWVSEITDYTPWGNEIENKDALENYSAAVFGYKNTLPVMVAQNARYREIASDNFEDYNMYLGSFECAEYHSRWVPSSGGSVSGSEAHTGWYSLFIPDGGTATMTRPIEDLQTTRREYPKVPFVLRDYDLLGFFSPVKNDTATYVLNYWIKKEGFNPLMSSYNAVNPIVTINSVDRVLAPSIQRSVLIEGWQRVECLFYVPVSATGNIDVTIDVGSSTGNYFLDDIRIHPFDAVAKTFVYDKISMKFMAELDENNYATFYEYDEEGALIRVKKETERGIMTIQENRNKLYKSNLSN